MSCWLSSGFSVLFVRQQGMLSLYALLDVVTTENEADDNLRIAVPFYVSQIRSICHRIRSIRIIDIR